MESALSPYHSSSTIPTLVSDINQIDVDDNNTTTMSSSRRQTLRPVVVEIRPDNVPSSISPSSPSSSSKAVRFAPTSANGSSRPLTSTEAWSLYHFEMHARSCSQCFDPLTVYKRGNSLCQVGLGLAQDVACHVYHREGDVYSTKKDDSKLVRVEVQHDYDQVRLLLRAMERRLRSHRMSTVPLVSYDRSYPVAPRRFYREAEDVYIEPSNSERLHRRTSKHKPVRYSTVVLNDDVEDVSIKSTPSLPTKERRGTLYEKDMQRKKENYLVEIREPRQPERRDRRRRDYDDGRRNSVWL